MIWNILVKQFLMYYFLSKATGGIGFICYKITRRRLILKSNNTASSGPIPFMHTIDSAVRAVQRGSKKKGALCFYMENWHLNFQDFIDLKQNAEDDYRRVLYCSKILLCLFLMNLCVE